MEHATIVGVVVPAAVHPSLTGVRLLLAVPEDHLGRVAGEPYVLADGLQAGPGQRVQVVRGREAALTLPGGFAPVDVAVVAIVDDLDGTP